MKKFALIFVILFSVHAFADDPSDGGGNDGSSDPTPTAPEELSPRDTLNVQTFNRDYYSGYAQPSKKPDEYKKDWYYNQAARVEDVRNGKYEPMMQAGDTYRNCLAKCKGSDLSCSRGCNDQYVRSQAIPANQY